MGAHTGHTLYNRLTGKAGTYFWPAAIRYCILLVIVVVAAVLIGARTHGLPYGVGQYGTCTYGDCSISLSTDGTLPIAITPQSGTVCSVEKDTLEVTTHASTGYTLQMATSNATNELEGAATSSEVAPVSGTSASPTALSANTWGFRVDGLSGFGAGPTSALSNGSVPSQSFAAVPVSSTPTTVASSSEAVDAQHTDAWYGVCVDSSLPADSYSEVITYTAIVNT